MKSTATASAKLSPRSPPHPIAFNGRTNSSIPATDGRSAEAQFRKRLRAALATQAGTNISVTQSVLIDLAVDTAVEIERMKLRRAQNGALSLHDHKSFLAYANAYRRHLVALGVKPGTAPARTLQEHLAATQKATAA